MAKGLLQDLGVDIARFETAFDRDHYPGRGMSRAMFFRKETFGEDKLVTGSPFLGVAEDVEALVDLRDGKLRWQIPGAYDYAIFSPDGTRLFASSQRLRQFVMVDAATGEILVNQPAQATALALSRDGRRIALGLGLTHAGPRNQFADLGLDGTQLADAGDIHQQGGPREAHGHHGNQRLAAGYEARVFVGTRDLGTPPLTIDVPEGATVEVDVKLDGYRSEHLALDGTQAKVQVALKRLAGPRPTAASTARTGASTAAATAAPPPTTAAPPPKPIGGSDIVNPWAK